MTVSGIRNHKWAGENVSTLKLLIDALCIKAKILQIDFFSFFLTSFLWSKLLSEEKKKKKLLQCFFSLIVHHQSWRKKQVEN